MSDFQIFFSEGFKHITDVNGIDHILFITALTCKYLIGDLRKLLVLVTAFTIGHSITLALSSFHILTLNRDVVEFLIPLTILATAIYNLTTAKTSGNRLNWIYITALFFGLIHGLGFSSYLKSLFGKDESIWVQLLSFNLGLEAGQLLIVAVLLFISFIFVTLLKIRQRTYVMILSAAVAMLSLKMLIERFPF